MNKLEAELKTAIDTTEVKLKWIEDPQGYFTIKPFFDKSRVYVRYYKAGKLVQTFSGTDTSQLIQELLDRGLISRLDHAAYLGKEIEKALIALRNNLTYVQDNELAL